VDLGHTEIAGGHLFERFRLFYIIALGETVLTMGSAFTDEPFKAERLLALAIAFTSAVALWWCYFERSERIGIAAADTFEAVGAVAWWSTWTLTLIVRALIGIAVADELAIAHPRGSATPAEGRWIGARQLPPVAAAGTGHLAAATSPLTLIVGVGAASAVLVAVATADTARESSRSG
jgi:low temperature requirement protein LtrA